MLYLMYEIKNNINGKIYVGVHKTKVEDDGYMGSGKAIKAAIKKYGIENFTKTVLDRFATEEEMFEREKEVVNEEFLSRDDVYNVVHGGCGGWTYARSKISDEVKRKISDTMNSDEWQAIHLTDDVRKTKSDRMKKMNPSYSFVNIEKQRKSLSKKMNSDEWKTSIGNQRSKKISDTMTGRSVDDDVKSKISNSMIGMVRVTINGKRTRIKKELVTDDMILGWINGDVV